MQEFYYAQIDENHVCFGISSLSGEVNSDNMIRLQEYDISLLGKKYKDGKWIEVPQNNNPLPLSETEQAIHETAVNTEYLVALADLGL